MADLREMDLGILASLSRDELCAHMREEYKAQCDKNVHPTDLDPNWYNGFYSGAYGVLRLLDIWDVRKKVHDPDIDAMRILSLNESRMLHIKELDTPSFQLHAGRVKKGKPR